MVDLGSGTTQTGEFSVSQSCVTDSRFTPSYVRGDLSSLSVVTMAAGVGHSLFVVSDGRVFSTGGGYPENYGSLGLGLGDKEDRCTEM